MAAPVSATFTKSLSNNSGLWVDKHRPTQLKHLDYHLQQATQLKQLVESGDLPHLLVYGPSGAGKKTRVRCILRELYGIGAERLRIEHKQFTAPSGKKLDIATVGSNYHVEINPGDVGIYDRVVVMELIKTMAQTQQLDTNSQKNFKVVVLSEVDRLTRDAQQALRRTMEKYMSSCRIVLVTQSISKVIEPLRSRCLPVRVPAPDNETIGRILQSVCRAERVELSDRLAERIASYAQGNLRLALLTAETCHVHSGSLSSDDCPIVELDWLVYIRDTAALIVQNQTPETLLKVRERFYELLTRCIPPTVIFQRLVLELSAHCDAELRCVLVSLAAEFEHSMQRGSKPIFHLEAFVASLMRDYKQFLLNVAANF